MEKRCSNCRYCQEIWTAADWGIMHYGGFYCKRRAPKRGLFGRPKWPHFKGNSYDSYCGDFEQQREGEK